MKGWKLNAIGDMQFDTKVDMPSISSNEVLIRVKAAGVCGSDIPRVYENGAHRTPLIIGHEFSGCVIQVGDRVNKKWRGKRVGVFPLIPCKHCEACLERKYEMCIQYSYMGSSIDGGFAEYVAVPEWNLIELPDNVTYEQAAMLEPMAVAVHAMRQLSITQDMHVVVSGLGTIGQLLIMFLQEHGIKNVYALGNKVSQKKAAMDLRISENNYCDVSDGDAKEWIMLKTNQHGVDVYFDCVGKNESVSLGIDTACAGGQVCLVGNPYTDMTFTKELYWKILRRQLTIKGTWNSSYLGDADVDSPADDWNYVLRRIGQGRIAPEKLITHKLKLEELEKGLHIMKDKTEDYTKIMLVE